MNAPGALITEYYTWPFRDPAANTPYMVYDYNKLYANTPDALGAPTAVFVDFFDRYPHKTARVLDVGCGQGRDALFIARLGHDVVGVDISANGIRDILRVAKQENLSIQGDVADITTYTPDGKFDVIVIDRTLHMLREADRLGVLATLLDHTNQGGWVLIADETANIQGFQTVINDHRLNWSTDLSKRGTLFVRRS